MQNENSETRSPAVLVAAAPVQVVPVQWLIQSIDSDIQNANYERSSLRVGAGIQVCAAYSNSLSTLRYSFN